MNRFVTLAAAAMLFLPAIAHGQAVQTARTYQGQDGQSKEALGTFCVPDMAGNGCPAGGGGTSTRTTAAGTTDTQAVPVQGVTGGVPILATLAAPTPAGTNNIGAVNLAAGGTALTAGTTANAAIATTGINVVGTNAFSRVFNGSTWSPQLADASGRAYIVTVADSTSTSGVAPVASSAASSGVVVKASAGNLFGLNVASGATAGVVQLINAAAIPADGAVTPLKCYYLAANTSLDLNLRAAPVYFSTGIVAVFSSGSSCFTKAASATAFISGDAK